MASKLFLLNTELMSLDAASDPRLDPEFPLTKEQYDSLSVDDLMMLLREEFQNDPKISQHQPQVVTSLCALLSAKAGINCVRVHWDGFGMSSRHGHVPDLSLQTLASLALRQPLTDRAVDEMIWSQLPVEEP